MRRANMVNRAILLKRLLLVSIVVGQVTLAPIILFSLTYLPDVDYQNATIGIRTGLFHWILIAGLSYGAVSIALALIMGGYRPFFVSNRGGLAPFLGLSRMKNDPELIDRARLSLFGSPYGKMARLVHHKTKAGEHDLMAIHGGLQLLAVPMQVILIAVPLAIMEGVPETVIKPNTAFELGMAGYIIALWISVRVHPAVSWHLVGIAAMFRNVVWRVSKLSWILPIFLYWVVARVVLMVTLSWLGVDYSQWHEMQLEKVILHAVAPEAEVPETAILDYIVAISVLPMATFTTISVLGGSQSMPDWMMGQEEGLESLRGMHLKAPEEEGASPTGGKSEIADEHVVGGDQLGEEGESEEEGGIRMIDLPFSLFDDD
ncbi:MAG: hypothetical protein QF760_00705 [Candidatus Thalassarchaeaceae archaeon]|nr:hypothetical protein [Candidatus Thalassarchaeaceae archaeon]